MAEPKSRSLAPRLLKGVLAIGAIAWLVHTGAFAPDAVESIDFDWSWGVAALAVFGASQVLAALRWRLLLRTQGISARIGQCYELILVGFFFNQFMLGATGGDLVRAAGIARQHPERRTGAVLSVAVDRGLGLSMLVVMAIGMGILQTSRVLAEPEIASFLAVAMAALVMGGTLLALIYRQRDRTRRLLTRLVSSSLAETLFLSVERYGKRPSDLVRGAGLSLLLHLGTVAMNYCLARALIGDTIDALGFLLLIPIANAAMAIPINPPGAIGTGEAIYAHLLALVGFPLGGMVCALQRVVFFAWAAPATLIWAIGGHRTDIALAGSGKQLARHQPGETT